MAFQQDPGQRRGISPQAQSQSPFQPQPAHSPVLPTSSNDPLPRPPFYVAALYPFSGENTSAMSFRQGDIIEVLSMLPSGWWDGIICDGDSVRGWFPSNYVQIISDEEAMLARENNSRGYWGPDEEDSANMQRRTSEIDTGFLNGRPTEYSTPRGGRSGSMSSGRDTTFDDLAGDDLTSFSSGGGIFAEIAEAAAQNSTRDGDEYGVRTNGHSTAQQEDQDDFWVPKVTTAGQLFYYNTRTGETSRDMPIDGRGDGTYISRDEFSNDPAEDAASEAGDRPTLSIDPHWTPKLTSDGAAVYYVNTKTGERTWSPPSSAPVPLSSTSSAASTSDQAAYAGATLKPSSTVRASVGGASLLSTLTDRTAIKGGETDSQKAATLRRVSAYSDDSALDAVLDRGDRNSKGKSVEIAQDANGDSGEGGTAPKEKRKSRVRGRKAVAATELLEPPPPPLIIDLEALVTGALQELISSVGVGGVALQGNAAQVNPQRERDQLAGLGEAVVGAVRTLLHSSGVLEHLGSSPGASTSNAAQTSDDASALSAQAIADLRPYTRRVTSSLSKLTFSIRAAWGVLETTAEDQTFDEDEFPLEDEDRAAKREQTLARWAEMRDRRFELEARQRTEVLIGARDVQISITTFLTELERIIGESTATSGGPPLPRNMLRAPKALQGSLRTNAAALLLPGGGFGGNWRGNGFVTLPSPDSTPLMPSSATLPSPATPSLGYSYPSKSLTSEVAATLHQDSAPLVNEAAALCSFVKTLASATPSTPTDSSLPLDQLLQKTGSLQRKLAGFLTKVEDIDVSATVDYELAPDPPSRPNSRRESHSASSATVSTIADSAKESDVESMLDPAPSDYRKSVQEARPLLAELEVGKQALYDIAPAILAALQELYMSPTQFVSTLPPTTGAQPSKTSPLESFVSPVRTEFSPTTILDVLADLTSAVGRLCTTIIALGAIAAIQAAAPTHLRQHTATYRSSLYDQQNSLSSSSIADSRTADSSRLNGQTAPSTSGNTNSTTLSPSSSRQSLARTEDENAEMSSTSRDSVDSDYFFSRGPKPPAPSMPKSAQLFNAGASWVKRPPSASSNSVNSKGEIRARVSSTDEPSTPPAPSPSKKDLAKILGDEVGSKSSEAAGVSPWLASDYLADEVSFTSDKQVRGGTLRALVIAACSHEGRVDSNFLSAFLMTYRTFCGPHQLLDLLIQRYNIEPPPGLTTEQYREWETRKRSPVRARVANFLKSWVRDHMDHDEFDGDLLRRIAEFASKKMSEGAQAIQISKAVDDRLKGTSMGKVGNLAPGAIPSSIVPRNFRKLKFTDIDALEVARQLTIKDSALFAKITAQECLGKAWPKEYGAEAPNISAMIDMSNAVTRWVTETILAQDDLKKRANVIKHFINVADRCLSLNNFSTLIHIIAGLNSTPIHRLRRTWETVNQRSATILHGLNNVMRPDKNYKVYREALRGVAPPCVPFLGVYLTDWTFIGDGNPDMLREKPHQINFNKRQKASELILQIKVHQTTIYNLAAVPALSQWLDQQLFPPGSNLATDDQRLYDISLAREPRERDDEKIARLLSESGFL